MNEISEIENTENDGLLKKKKTRPPQSEKQKEAFQRAAAKRAENVKLRKEQKLLEAQKALLEKEGYIKQPSKKKEIQFEIEEETPEETPVEMPKEIIKELPSKKKGKLVPPPLAPKENIKKQPRVKKEPQVIIQSSSDDGDSDDDSSSEDEVIVIKRSKKYKSKTKAKPREESPYEEDAYNGNQGYVGKSQPQINWTDMFC